MAAAATTNYKSTASQPVHPLAIVRASDVQSIASGITSTSLCDQILGEEDCIVILEELETVAHRWYDIGLSLGFKSSTLDSIKSKGQDVHELLRNMIIEWLKMSYNVERFGPPTWRRIAEAVRANSGGKNPALADNLAKKYGVVVQDSQPVTSPNATTSSAATSAEEHTTSYSLCCCCSPTHLSKSEKSGSEMRTRTGSLTQQIRKPWAKNEHRPLLEESVHFLRYPPSINASRTDVLYINRFVHRPLSMSLPSESFLETPSSSDYGTSELEESRETISADPTWEIKEIVQLRSYWGAITGAEAEHRLKRLGQNCYLIRYSNAKRCYILSVRARNQQQLTLQSYHLKLSVTKEGDHNVYEVEGTEQKFYKISEMLEFYQKHPLTRSKCTTIGKPCVQAQLHSI